MGNYFSSENDKQTKKSYGWKKDQQDANDHWHNFTLSVNHHSIKNVDLSKRCPQVLDQGTFKSCTANALSSVYQFDMMKEGEQHIFTPSRLFIYYNERKVENSTDEDCGASIKDGIKSINKKGVCPESMWTYDENNVFEEPSLECYKETSRHKAVEYKRVEQELNQLKACIIEGFPIVFGFKVFSSFESDQVSKQGIMPMPDVENEEVLGGHCCYIVGFSEDNKSFLVRNSYGENWGLEGNFWMPYEFALNSEYCSDFWTIKRVSDSHKNNQKFQYPKKVNRRKNRRNNNNNNNTNNTNNNTNNNKNNNTNNNKANIYQALYKTDVNDFAKFDYLD